MSVHLCTADSMGIGDECAVCGGWIHADGCVPRGMPALRVDGYAGPICSEECVEGAHQILDRNARRYV